MFSLPRIFNHSIWMSDDQVMTKKKKDGFKKTDSISPKTQHFLYTKFSSIEDHNQTKQPFQTRFLHKQRYSKPPIKYLYKIPYTNSYQNSLHIIPDFFFSLNLSSSLLLLFFFLFSSLLSFSLLLFSLPLRKNPNQMIYFVLR